MTPTPSLSLFQLSPEALATKVVELGGKKFQGKIIRRNVLEKGRIDYAAMTDLSIALRDRLQEELPVFSSELTSEVVARDGTTKLLLAFPRGRAKSIDDPNGTVAGQPELTERDLSVETVHIPPVGSRAETEAGEPRGATLCVSSQAGCPVGCPFCASGLLGLARNLEAHEIIEQYVRGRAVGPLRRSVVMGIGEPLLNFANLSAALEVVRDEMGLGGRKLTVSTVGFPDRLRKVALEKPRFQLAISLHTPDQDQRDHLVPAMRGVPIEEILAAGDFWFETTGREITYEYVLLGGDNDSPGHAQRLIERLRGRRCSVNLIPYNPSPALPFDRPDSGAAEAFRDQLLEGGLVATLRWSRGLDGAAACGQLRLTR
ncbi:MAG: 23S rRNA (adenine(2503)-C(2))-methyltransferase RlmN [Planctomycetota bacterium]